MRVTDNIVWQKTGIGAKEPSHLFTAIAPNGIDIGRIYRIDGGPLSGRWRWIFLLGHSQFRQGMMSGDQASRQRAAAQVGKTYEHHLETPGCAGGVKSGYRQKSNQIKTQQFDILALSIQVMVWAGTCTSDCAQAVETDERTVPLLPRAGHGICAAGCTRFLFDGGCATQPRSHDSAATARNRRITNPLYLRSRTRPPTTDARHLPSTPPSALALRKAPCPRLFRQRLT